MRLEYQILAAIALDLLIGDPCWFPHPVKLIGRMAQSLEAPMRKAISNATAAGVATALIVILVSGGATAALMIGAYRVNAGFGSLVSVLLLYMTIASKDLVKHSDDVYEALRAGDMPLARSRLARIVGRDTENLNEHAIVRAAVESVAENTVDGITAPIFYAVLFGPVGAMTFKAISTLDSTFGYKNERYGDFGWASARIDDVANYFPARLTAPLIVLAAFILRLHPINAVRICVRDRKKHASPNSGIPESAVAGALGVQLGGHVHRKGVRIELPMLGDPLVKLEREHIRQSNRLALITTVLSALTFLAMRVIAMRY